jgi:hypothetical protein
MEQEGESTLCKGCYKWENVFFGGVYFGIFWAHFFFDFIKHVDKHIKWNLI